MFGSFSWSDNQEKFAFIGEKKSLDSKDFSKFVEIENFGERLQSVKDPVLCVLTISSRSIQLIDISYSDNIEGSVRCPAQPVFANDNSIVFMGIDVGSKKLGMTYIYCRSSSIYHLNLSNYQASTF